MRKKNVWPWERHKSVSWLSHVTGGGWRPNKHWAPHTMSSEDRPGPLPEMEHVSLHPISHIPEWIFPGDSKSKQTEIKLSAVSTGHLGVLGQKQPNGLHGDPITWSHRHNALWGPLFYLSVSTGMIIWVFQKYPGLQTLPCLMAVDRYNCTCLFRWACLSGGPCAP